MCTTSIAKSVAALTLLLLLFLTAACSKSPAQRSTAADGSAVLANGSRSSKDVERQLSGVWMESPEAITAGSEETFSWGSSKISFSSLALIPTLGN